MNAQTHQHATSKRIVEPFDQLNGCTLAASRGTDKGNVCSGIDNQVQVAKDTNAGPCRIPEVDLFESDLAASRLGVNFSSLSRLSIDLGDLIEEVDDVVGGSSCGGDVRDEAEDVAGLDATEGNGLVR